MQTHVHLGSSLAGKILQQFPLWWCFNIAVSGPGCRLLPPSHALVLIQLKFQPYFIFSSLPLCFKTKSFTILWNASQNNLLSPFHLLPFSQIIFDSIWLKFWARELWCLSYRRPHMAERNSTSHSCFSQSQWDLLPLSSREIRPVHCILNVKEQMSHFLYPYLIALA